MIESMLVGVFAFLTSLFIYLYVSQIKKNKEIINNAMQLLVLQQTISDESKTDKEQANEDFLKFISDSRDWAYTYIDEVQESLNKFITDIEPEINYFKEYGDIGSMSPNYYSMKKIVEAYEELKKLLPEGYGRIDT